jgi:hypothetical protein
VFEQKDIKERLEELDRPGSEMLTQITEIVELAKAACLTYKLGSTEEKREMVMTVMSNPVVEGKTVLVMLHSPFQQIANSAKSSCGGPTQAGCLSVKALVTDLIKWLHDNPGWRIKESARKTLSRSLGTLHTAVVADEFDDTQKQPLSNNSADSPPPIQIPRDLSQGTSP